MTVAMGLLSTVNLSEHLSMVALVMMQMLFVLLPVAVTVQADCAA